MQSRSRESAGTQWSLLIGQSLAELSLGGQWSQLLGRDFEGGTNEAL